MDCGRALRRFEWQNSHLIAKRQMWLYAFLFVAAPELRYVGNTSVASRSRLR
jgi:hypothetical protein